MPEKLTPLFNGASGEYYQGEVTVTDAGREHYCAICKVTLKSDSEWNQHVKSNKHEQRVTDTRDLLRNHFLIRDQARQKVPRCLAIPHVPWQDAVFAKFGRVLVNDDGENEAEVMASVDPLLDKLELYETISLLELAVWKGICCGNCPESVTGYFAFQQWMTEGWKQEKEKFRRSEEVITIMKQVVPFFEVPSVESAAQKVNFPTLM